jgi:hypothetical protein
MPSRYYNPRLAKNLADAYKQEVLDLATPIERAFQPFVQMTEKRYQEKLIEKEKYEKQMEKIRAEQDSFFKDMPVVDPNKLDDSIRDFATQDLMRSQQEYRWIVENTQGYDRIKGTGDKKNDINYWGEINTKLATYQQDYIDRRNTDQPGGDRTSNVNDAVTIEMDRRKANKEFDAVYRNKEGQLVALFNPREDSAIEQPIELPFDQWDKAFIPKERQTKKYVETIASFDKMIDTAKREQRWEDDPTNISEIESTLESLTFSKDEALSIAVDQLGLEPEEYAGTISADLDDDGIPGTIDDVNFFIKENLRQNVFKQLKDLKGAYEKTLKTQGGKKLTVSEQNRLDKLNRVSETRESVFNMKFPHDKKGNIDITSPVFWNKLAEAGFSVTGNPFQDDKGNWVLNIKNNLTNDQTLLSSSNMYDTDLRRILMMLAGDTKENIDKQFPETFIGPSTESTVVLPGLTTQQ